MNDRETPEFWADWLVDAVAGATQDRRFLRGDEAEDKIITEALYANILKGMKNLLRHRISEEMEDCTILFKECDRGHGRLTATNWVQHGCKQCEIDKLRDVLTWSEENCPGKCAGVIREALIKSASK